MDKTFKSRLLCGVVGAAMSCMAGGAVAQSASHAASVEEAELKLSYDLFYLKHWNTGLDLLILLKTIKTVLKAKGR